MFVVMALGSQDVLSFAKRSCDPLLCRDEHELFQGNAVAAGQKFPLRFEGLVKSVHARKSFLALAFGIATPERSRNSFGGRHDLSARACPSFSFTPPNREILGPATPCQKNPRFFPETGLSFLLHAITLGKGFIRTLPFVSF